MKTLRWVIIPVGLCVGLAAFAGDQVSIQPGLWQFESKTTVTGMPFAMPARTSMVKKCVTENEARKIWKSATQSKDEKCDYTDLERTGNHVAWKMKCTGSNAMEGQGELTFESSTAYHGKMDMSMSSEGQSMKTHLEFTGHRVGDCKDKH